MSNTDVLFTVLLKYINELELISGETPRIEEINEYKEFVLSNDDFDVCREEFENRFGTLTTEELEKLIEDPKQKQVVRLFFLVDQLTSLQEELEENRLELSNKDDVKVIIHSVIADTTGMLMSYIRAFEENGINVSGMQGVKEKIISLESATDSSKSFEIIEKIYEGMKAISWEELQQSNPEIQSFILSIPYMGSAHKFILKNII